MQQRQQKIVHGYVRRNHKENIPSEIIDIIYKFYLLYLYSKIMNDDQQLLFVNLICDRLESQHDEAKNTKSIDFDLLYRGSENEYL